MLELPEVLTIAEQLRNTITDKTVSNVLPPNKEHKFCWYQGDPAEYGTALAAHKVTTVDGFGIYVEISFEGGYKLCFNDGVNARLLPKEEVPKSYQLLIDFDDGMVLAFTVAMYGGIILHSGNYDNEYYQKSRQVISVFSPEFELHFRKWMAESKPTLSAKAFMATEQRFPGIGNGVLQDILFEARIHPKKKLQAMGAEEKDRLLACTVAVLREMLDRGGRDTEKDIFGNPGGYQTKLSKNTWKAPCPVCGGELVKEAYLGGSVYYCPTCQPAEKKGK